MVPAHYFENCMSQGFHILYSDWSYRGHDPYRFCVHQVKS